MFCIYFKFLNCFFVQDAIKHENGRNVCGSRIIVDWANSSRPPVCRQSAWSKSSKANALHVFAVHLSHCHLTKLLLLEWHLLSYWGCTGEWAAETEIELINSIYKETVLVYWQLAAGPQSGQVAYNSKTVKDRLDSSWRSDFHCNWCWYL